MLRPKLIIIFSFNILNSTSVSNWLSSLCSLATKCLFEMRTTPQSVQQQQQPRMWPLLLILCRIRSALARPHRQESSSPAALDSLISRLSSRIFDEEEATGGGGGDYEKLVAFIASSGLDQDAQHQVAARLSEYSSNRRVCLDLIEQLESHTAKSSSAAANTRRQRFYSSVLFGGTVHDWRQVFYTLLAVDTNTDKKESGHIHRLDWDLLRRLYLDKRLSYLYRDCYEAAKLFGTPESEDSNRARLIHLTACLKRVDHVLTVLGVMNAGAREVIRFKVGNFVVRVWCLQREKVKILRFQTIKKKK